MRASALHSFEWCCLVRQSLTGNGKSLWELRRLPLLVRHCTLGLVLALRFTYKHSFGKPRLISTGSHPCLIFSIKFVRPSRLYKRGSADIPTLPTVSPCLLWASLLVSPTTTQSSTPQDGFCLRRLGLNTVTAPLHRTVILLLCAFTSVNNMWHSIVITLW